MDHPAGVINFWRDKAVQRGFMSGAVDLEHRTTLADAVLPSCSVEIALRVRSEAADRASPIFPRERVQMEFLRTW